jgi:hypothetical protein
MEQQNQTHDAGRPAAEHADRQEPAAAVRQTFGEPTSHETRIVAQPAVAGDGQLVEAGYGHGV